VNRLQAFAILLLLWAAIYLPGLGSTEIKGEEGRRILPAITMLEGGDWIVPHIGGKPFLRKPPLVNWAIAGSMKLTGMRNEWAARLPSALCVLALVGAIVAVSGRRERTMFTTDVSFIAAVMVLTQAGLLAKARFAGAEIEGLYVPLSGIATVLWMGWWVQGRSSWLVWTVPWIFLGLGLLAKGPLHLLFFYALVLAVLWRAGEWRTLWHPAHIVGIVLMLAIFAGWAVPYFRSEAAMEAAKVWQDQFAGRVTGNVFDWKSWLLNIPRGLSDQLPWVLFAPLLWIRRDAWSGREGALVRGALVALPVCFFGLLLVPGVLTRYVLPIGIPLAMLLAASLAEEKLDPPSEALRPWWQVNVGLAGVLLALAILGPIGVAVAFRRITDETGELLPGGATLLTWPLLASAVAVIVTLSIVLARRRFARPTRIAGATAALCGVAAMLYAADVVPFINRADDIRPLARRIDAAVPAGRELVLYDPGWQPAIVYLQTRYRYAPVMEAIPTDAEFVLARDRAERKFARNDRISWCASGSPGGAKATTFYSTSAGQRRERADGIAYYYFIRLAGQALPESHGIFRLRSARLSTSAPLKMTASACHNQIACR
jgi:4-amino-4-deoxy-L-arabinose transferase-like glycosyltransferase